MADNVQLNSGSGGAIAASDDIGGVQYQRVKITLGADGVNDGDVSSSNYMPTSIYGMGTAFVTTSTPLTGGASWTSATQTVTAEGNGLTFFCIADQNGTVYLEESTDNVNWTVTASSPYVANVPFAEQHVAHSLYFRVKFTNGASAQGTFRASLGHIPFANPWMIKLDPNVNYVQQAGAPWYIAGQYDHNSSTTPSGKGQYMLPAVATATWAAVGEGKLAHLSVDLEGNLRVKQDNRVTVSLANVSQSATNTTIANSNTARQGMIVHNDSTDTLYIKFGTTASATSYTYKVAPDSTLEIASCFGYTGQIDGIWSAGGSGAARVTDLSAA